MHRVRLRRKISPYRTGGQAGVRRKRYALLSAHRAAVVVVLDRLLRVGPAQELVRMPVFDLALARAVEDGFAARAPLHDLILHAARLALGLVAHWHQYALGLVALLDRHCPVLSLASSRLKDDMSVFLSVTAPVFTGEEHAVFPSTVARVCGNGAHGTLYLLWPTKCGARCLQSPAPPSLAEQNTLPVHCCRASPQPSSR